MSRSIYFQQRRWNRKKRKKNMIFSLSLGKSWDRLWFQGFFSLSISFQLSWKPANICINRFEAIFFSCVPFVVSWKQQIANVHKHTQNNILFIYKKRNTCLRRKNSQMKIIEDSIQGRIRLYFSPCIQRVKWTKKESRIQENETKGNEVHYAPCTLHSLHYYHGYKDNTGRYKKKNKNILLNVVFFRCCCC